MADSHVVAMCVARCTVFFARKFCYTATMFLVLLSSKRALQPCLWICSAQMEANSPTFFPPWFGLFRHKQARPKMNKTKSQRKCKQRGVKRSSLFYRHQTLYCANILHTPLKWTTAYLAAHPTPLTMTHSKRYSLHRHAFGFSSNPP